MSEKIFWGILYLIGLIIFGITWTNASDNNQKCINQRGVMVRGVYGFACVKGIKNE